MSLPVNRHRPAVELTAVDYNAAIGVSNKVCKKPTQGKATKRRGKIWIKIKIKIRIKISISLSNNEHVFDDKSGGEGWQNDALRQL